MSTTRPRRLLSVNGSELIHVPGANSGAAASVIFGGISGKDPNARQLFVKVNAPISNPVTTVPTISRTRVSYLINSSFAFTNCVQKTTLEFCIACQNTSKEGWFTPAVPEGFVGEIAGVNHPSLLVLWCLHFWSFDVLQYRPHRSRARM